MERGDASGRETESIVSPDPLEVGIAIAWIGTVGEEGAEETWTGSVGVLGGE